MKTIMAAVLVVVTLIACSRFKPTDTPALIETQRKVVADCVSLGVVSETSDAGNPFSFYATRRMLSTVRHRARQRGGTHLVWLHRTAESAAAEVFQCQ